MNLNKKFFLKRILKFSFIFIFIVFLTKSLFEESVEKKEEKKEKNFIYYSNDIKIFDSNDENTFYNNYRRVKDHRIDSCKIIENQS